MSRRTFSRLVVGLAVTTILLITSSTMPLHSKAPLVQVAHAASWTVGSTFASDAEQAVQTIEPGHVPGSDCAWWLSWFMTTYYGMPASFDNAWTDTLVNNLIADGDVNIITGDGSYSPSGFVPANQIPALLNSLDPTGAYIFAYKWSDAAAVPGATADHLAVYVGNGEVVSHGIAADAAGDEYNIVPRPWNGFNYMNRVMIIQLTNTSTTEGTPPTGSGYSGIIDTQSPNFHLQGQPGDWTCTTDGVDTADGAPMCWTWNNGPSPSGDLAVWSYPGASPAECDVAIYVDDNYATAAQTAYDIHANGTDNPLSLAQVSLTGWQLAGSYYLQPGDYVSLSDQDGADPFQSQMIGADAVSFNCQ